MTKRLILILCLFCAVALSAETPREGAKAIHKLIKDRDYSELFQTRYSEWFTLEDANKRPEEAIEKLGSVWELNRDVVLSIFKQLSKADFEISENPNPLENETGEVATADVQIGQREVPYKLYKMTNGLWAFHM